jgi:hypothetical protein
MLVKEKRSERQGPPRAYQATTTPPLPLDADPDELEEMEALFRFGDEVKLRQWTRVRLLKTARILASESTDYLGPNHPSETITARYGTLGWVNSFASAGTVTKKSHLGLLGEFGSPDQMAVEVLLEGGEYFFVGMAEEEVQKQESSWSRVQIPLEAAYALTTHKVMGCEFKEVIIAMTDDNRLFPGQFLTALSRSKYLKDVTIDHNLSIEFMNSGPHPEVQKFYSKTFPHINFAWTKKIPDQIVIGTKRSHQLIE